MDAKKGRGRPSGATKAAKKDQGKTRKRKMKKPDNGIKKPTSAYIYFVAHYRSELKEKGEPTNKVQEIAKKCGALWKEMTDADKAPFNALAKKDKERYQQSKSEEDLAKGKDPNKPKRAPTAYFIFLADFREELKKNPPSDPQARIPTLAGERWKQMTEAQKKPYNEKAAEAKEQYQEDIENYKKSHPVEPKATKKSSPKKRKPEPEPVEEDDEEEDDDDDDDDDDEEEEEEEDSDE